MTEYYLRLEDKREERIMNYFTKEDSKIVKGLAIIFMLMHHLWTSSNNTWRELKYIFNIQEISSISFLGGAGKICVSIFFFIGGYGIYQCSQSENFNIVERIKKLYIAYWKVFFILIPIAFIFFGNQSSYLNNTSLCNRYEEFRINEFILNLLGISASYNSEWW